MNYNALLSTFRTCMEDIGNALRSLLGTNKKYKITEVADAIKSCNLGTDVILVHSGSISQSGTNVNLTSIPGYKNLSMSNFVCCINSIYRREVYMSSYRAYPACSYNASSGILTLKIGESNSYSNDSEQTGWEGSMTVYLILDTSVIKRL